MNYIKYITALLMFAFSCSILLAQMPEWKRVTDKDSNKYYIDGNCKIYTSGEPDFKYKPVTIDGIDYYLAQGKELLRNHYKNEGLNLLKSIIILQSKNGKVNAARKNASDEINKLRMNEGIRFEKIDKNASLLLVMENNVFRLINDRMKYSLRSSYPVEIISKRIREESRYEYYGILLGLKFDSQTKETGYDILIAIDGEESGVKTVNVKELENHWRKRLGSDTLERKLLKSENNQIIYEYTDKHTPFYSGFELFRMESERVFFMKIISDEKVFKEKKQKIYQIIEDFQVY